jgi:hypothetical protein
MLVACQERILPRWRELWYQANEILAPLMSDPKALAATKRFTEFVITPEFMIAANWRRCYEKPLGYPGDFEIMNQVYTWRPEGRTLFDKLVYWLGLVTIECIVARMVMMRQTIAETVLNSTSRPARVTSLGSGPAREIIDYLRLRELPRPVQFTLIDQDHTALSHAYEQAYPEVLRHKGLVTVDCLHASFSELMKGGELIGRIPPQDLIYSVGLIDYLTAKRARNLVASLYENVVPGGAVVVGNMMDAPRGSLWPQEFICDWSLIHRTHADMAAIAEGLPHAEISTAADPTGCVTMLTVKRLQAAP